MKTTGTVPQPRSRHSATLVNDKIYIFGGSDAHTTFNSLYALDIHTLKWSIPNCGGDTPQPSWGHSSLLYDNRIYFFGGNNGDTMSDSLNILNLDTFEWEVNVPVTFDKVKPVNRAGHTMTLYKDKFIVFGGSGNNDTLLNDTFVLDPVARCWKLFSGDNAPTLRCAHTAEIVNNLIYMFGGSDGRRYFKDISILDADKVIQKLEQMRPLKLSGGPSEATTVSSKPPTLPPLVIQQQQPSIPPPPQPLPSKLKPAATAQPLHPKFKHICEWLHKLNLSKYEASFVKNDITMDVLEYITDQHLQEDLKIQTLGARLKILNAIQLEKTKGKKNVPKEKDEKQVMRESIDSIKQMVDTLSASVHTLNAALERQGASHQTNNAGHVSPSLSAMNGRGRRNSNAAFDYPIK
eukprot:gene20113-24117_t